MQEDQNKRIFLFDFHIIIQSLPKISLRKELDEDDNENILLLNLNEYIHFNVFDVVIFIMLLDYSFFNALTRRVITRT